MYRTTSPSRLRFVSSVIMASDLAAMEFIAAGYRPNDNFAPPTSGPREIPRRHSRRRDERNSQLT
jgi:hypothetical protein